MRNLNPSAAGALAALSLLVAAAPASGQEAPDGNGVKVGETRLFPELRLDYFAYDNVYGDGAEPTEGSAVVVSPRVAWRAERRLVELEASYDGRYSAGSEDILDFDEHVLGLGASLSPSSRVGVDAFAAYRRLGEELQLQEPTAEEFNRERVDTERYELGGSVNYGAGGARGNVRLGLVIDGYSPDLPDGPRERFVQSRREFVRVEPFAQFSLRVSPDTRVLFETRFASLGYSEDGVRDNTRLSLLTGLSFAATGALRGEFRAGVTRIAFEGEGVDDETAARLDASLSYLPSSFSRFDLVLGRDFDPRFAEAGTAITTRAALDWRYDYSERVSHRARLGVADTVVDGVADCVVPGDRALDAGVELNLRVRRWLEFGAGVEHEIDRLEDCGDASALDPDLLEVDATRIGVHVRGII